MKSLHLTVIMLITGLIAGAAAGAMAKTVALLVSWMLAGSGSMSIIDPFKLAPPLLFAMIPGFLLVALWLVGLAGWWREARKSADQTTRIAPVVVAAVFAGVMLVTSALVLD
ncbi:MAG TPA: hypothetical protein VG942_00820 [Hyphomonadaceae bacterium]|nr:hypothetical protein [Hyphomonadaceae bacterium]